MDTPLSPRLVKRLSVFLTGSAAICLVMSFHETDGVGRDHVFSGVQRVLWAMVPKSLQNETQGSTKED